MGRVGLYVKCTARPDQRDALVDQLLGAARLIDAAPGCELYLVNTSPAEPDTGWVTEVWSSIEAHDASLSVAGVREAIRRALPLLAGPPERIDVVPVGGKGIAGT